ncbi:MAG: hypothetical protein ABIG93_01180 [archaeon]|nr:hypothetical protein [Nanoarchaeota archaeon]
MKRTVEYEMPKDEFEGLIDYLRTEGTYEVHSYRLMDKGTIDDGSSTSFEECRRFSEFQVPENCKLLTLRVKNPKLVKTIDSYFASKE